MTDRMRLGVDIDGVLADYVGDFGQYVLQREGIVPTEPTSWDFYNEWGIDRHEYDLLHRFFVLDGGFQTCSIVPDDDPRAWLQTIAADHDIYYVTARSAWGIPPSTIEFQTRRWLAEREFPEGKIVLDPDKSSACYYLDLHVHVDDSPGVIYEIAEAAWLKRVDTYPVVRSQLWNVATELPHRSYRANVLSETDAVIEAVAYAHANHFWTDADDE